MNIQPGALCLILMTFLAFPSIGMATSHTLSSNAVYYAEVPTSVSNMDKVYNQLLIEIERFEAVWKQQPHNMAALKRYSAQVRSLLDSLETMNAEPRQATSGGTITAGSGSLPGGQEATPSEGSSTSHIEATEGAFRGGPFNSGSSAPSISGLSDQWISGACEMAAEQLTLLDDVLQKDDFNASDFSSALGQLSATVQRIANPPMMKPPTNPRR